MKLFNHRPAILRRADFLSPRDLLQRAAAIVVIFVLLHLAGLREFTSVLNGTVGSVALGWRSSGVLAVIYIIFYLGTVVVAPILVLAAAILALWEKWLQARPGGVAETSMKER